ncbi:hypothetical protein [Litorimonas sp. WD9-15]|uniref:hypothetical protein n=1 Tax=Litorimonas sp. WD9-15 TaxID=3418716 RepID=UPI003CFC08C7
MSVETETPMETAATPNSGADIHPAAQPFLFLTRDKVRRNFLWLPLVGLIICSVLGVFHPQKHPLPYEQYIPGSWAIFGFLVFCGVGLCATTFAHFLARPESYYGEGGLPDPEDSLEASEAKGDAT